MSENTLLVCLHGFLGKPRDWDFLRENVQAEVWAPDYFADTSLGPKHQFWDWAKNFNEQVSEKKKLYKRVILVGYSLGGRLAQHAIIENQDLYTASVIVSSSAGMPEVNLNSEARKLRLEADQAWRQKIMNLSWSEFTTQWNAHAIFQSGLAELSRYEQDYNKEGLGLALTNWSLGRQEYLAPKLKQVRVPLYWMVGEKDKKYIEIAEVLREQGVPLKLSVAPEAAHRLIFDNPQFALKRMQQILAENNS